MTRIQKLTAPAQIARIHLMILDFVKMVDQVLVSYLSNEINDIKLFTTVKIYGYLSCNSNTIMYVSMLKGSGGSKFRLAFKC